VRGKNSFLNQPFWDTTEGMLVIAGVALVGGYILVKTVEGWGQKAASVGAGLVTGNNAITQSATDYGGAPETAYEGAGLLGTAGAAADIASGGLLASLGNSIGSGLYDLFHGSTTPVASAGGTSPAVGFTGSTAPGST
jgi:hypothetical protein